MSYPTQGPARKLISAREQIDADELEAMQAAGTLITDERRKRPLYFDGRFLAARDLTREQNYFLTRQSDLSKAGGHGVISGLNVDVKSATRIEIARGHGITSSGELVIVPQAHAVDLADVTETQRLDAAFGLARIPREPARNRTGLFIIALRAVEFTANPIGAYPTSITDKRGVEDGDIIEGVAVTLIPYADEGGQTQRGLRRARVARDIFVYKAMQGFPVGVLPLALVALDRGVVQWVDTYMVRREVGAENGDILGFGFAPRALREAHLLQYERHLGEVMQQRKAGNRGARFAAAEHFMALPPAGRMPAASINPDDFTQLFFPAEVEVSMTILPSDEVAALLEESLLLPPIDLTLSGDALRSTSVLVLLPVPRRLMQHRLGGLATMTKPLLPAAPGLIAKIKPLEALQKLKLPAVPPALDAQNVQDSPWREALAGTDFVWYMRRRNLKYKLDLLGDTQPAVFDPTQAENELVARLKEVGMESRYSKLKNRVENKDARAAISNLLRSHVFDYSPTLMDAVLYDFETTEVITESVIKGIMSRYGNPKLGEGILRVEELDDDFRGGKNSLKVVKPLAQTHAIEQFDEVARRLPEEQLKLFANEVAKAAIAVSNERNKEKKVTKMEALRKIIIDKWGES